ncbi:orexin/Hypocretin receptor type 1-like isoform X2 [Artemia franciscana]|uniref:orexin/Hypocretin receptor type 1-like isoform X2 n=1 Tax=Artemia franciscana TaxID=6661 RepID=UPI0032DBDDEF
MSVACQHSFRSELVRAGGCYCSFRIFVPFELFEHLPVGRVVLLYLLPLSFISCAHIQIIKVLWDKSLQNKTQGHCNSSNSDAFEAQLIRRRKAAKMLIVVVSTFAICYFPNHLLGIIKQTTEIPHNEYTTALSSISHWLVYLNSAINPIIYNFMNTMKNEDPK